MDDEQVLHEIEDLKNQIGAMHEEHKRILNQHEIVQKKVIQECERLRNEQDKMLPMLTQLKEFERLQHQQLEALQQFTRAKKTKKARNILALLCVWMFINILLEALASVWPPLDSPPKVLFTLGMLLFLFATSIALGLDVLS